MDNSTVLISLFFGILIVGALVYYLLGTKLAKEDVKPVITSSNNASNSLQLQAYERLTLLVDRIALPNLISRTPNGGLTAAEMQHILTKHIRDEYDYNVTQQIYVAPEVWNAIRNLKEKNILAINQIGQSLPPEATGVDLQRALLNYLMNEPKANLHELVSEALSYEANKHL